MLLNPRGSVNYNILFGRHKWMTWLWDEYVSPITLSQGNVQCEPSKRRRSDFMKSFILWNTSTSITWRSLLKVSRGFGATCLLATCFMLSYCLPYSSTLKMQATSSSETSVSFKRTTWRYVPQDRGFITASVRISTPIEQPCYTLKELIISINFKSIQIILKQDNSVEDQVTIRGMSCKTPNFIGKGASLKRLRNVCRIIHAIL
jgi:hypothetical protein